MLRAKMKNLRNVTRKSWTINRLDWRILCLSTTLHSCPMANKVIESKARAAYGNDSASVTWLHGNKNTLWSGTFSHCVVLFIFNIHLSRARSLISLICISYPCRSYAHKDMQHLAHLPQGYLTTLSNTMFALCTAER